MTALFAALVGAATALGKPDDAAHWQTTASKLEPLHRDGSGALLVAEGYPHTKSAPHLGHASAIYPFGLVTVEGSAEDRRTIAATLTDFKRVGTDFWEGASFAWYAAMLARCGLAERAIIGLDYFVRGFVSINGFHIGGDQTNKIEMKKKRGRLLASHRTERVFTLQGNFLALEAVHEMLLQCWGGTVRIFPATTQNWADVSFAGLRTENGLRVSATRAKGRTAHITLEATRDGVFRLRNPFGNAAPHWNRPGIRRTGADYVFALKRGQTLGGAGLNLSASSAGWKPAEDNQAILGLHANILAFPLRAAARWAERFIRISEVAFSAIRNAEMCGMSGNSHAVRASYQS